jgi:hypothetical protein
MRLPAACDLHYNYTMMHALHASSTPRPALQSSLWGFPWWMRCKGWAPAASQPCAPPPSPQGQQFVPRGHRAGCWHQPPAGRPLQRHACPGRRPLHQRLQRIPSCSQSIATITTMQCNTMQHHHNNNAMQNHTMQHHHDNNAMQYITKQPQPQPPPPQQQPPQQEQEQEVTSLQLSCMGTTLQLALYCIMV